MVTLNPLNLVVMRDEKKGSFVFLVVCLLLAFGLAESGLPVKLPLTNNKKGASYETNV